MAGGALIRRRAVIVGFIRHPDCASNAGQVLFSGIADPDRAALVAKGLLRPDFFSGWGIRTVARGEARFNPMSYHNGSVWPHDNALIALGLARYGLKQPIDRIFEGLFHAGTYMDHRRLPELFCGFRRQRGHGPTLYPVACAPQAWAAATPFALLQASLGLEFDPFTNEIRLNNPRLPGSSTKSCCATCNSARPTSICGFAVIIRRCRSTRPGPAAAFRFRSFIPPERPAAHFVWNKSAPARFGGLKPCRRQHALDFPDARWRRP